MTTPTTPTVERGPVRDADRSPAPDLARGFALLFIALANTPFYLWGASGHGLTYAHPTDGDTLDRIVQGIIMVAVDGRTYPLFAFLFGYGMYMLYRHQISAGLDDKAARRLIQVRNAWLLVFGFVHAALLWMGDILGAYGLAGLLLVWLFFRRKDVTLMVWAWVLVGLLAVGAVFQLIGGWAVMAFVGDDPAFSAEAGGFGFDLFVSVSEPNYLISILWRSLFWLVLVFAQGIISIVVPVAILLGFWAARRMILENPGAHLKKLRGTAVVGISIGWLGALPQMLAHTGVIEIPASAGWMFSGLTSVTGLFAGLGYAAVFGLIGHAIQKRREAGSGTPGRLGLSGAVMAVGKRSLSCYLMQSVLCAPVLAAWGFGLGGSMTSAQMALYAIFVWAVTLLLAAFWESKGWRGPAEIALRKLVYRR